jgi:hypothetical protein
VGSKSVSDRAPAGPGSGRVVPASPHHPSSGRGPCRGAACSGFASPGQSKPPPPTRRASRPQPPRPPPRAASPSLMRHYRLELSTLARAKVDLLLVRAARGAVPELGPVRHDRLPSHKHARDRGVSPSLDWCVTIDSSFSTGQRAPRPHQDV